MTTFFNRFFPHLLCQEILDARQHRVQRREELASRRSHASLERMRILSQLAYDPNGMSAHSTALLVFRFTLVQNGLATFFQSFVN